MIPKSHSKDKTKLYKVSAWCIFCYGSGLRRKRQTRGYGLDPRITIETCTRCKGRKRLWYIPGTSEHIKSTKIIPGLWPNNPYEKFKTRR